MPAATPLLQRPLPSVAHKPMTDRVYDVQTRNSGRLQTVLHPLRTDDGVDISLSHLERPGATDSVLLIHGLTTSSDMFVMPEHYGLAAFLHDAGFDVWIADFRMSNHYPYNLEKRFCFDDAGLYDWPASIARIRQHNQGRRIHVVAHCLGSLTFHIALYGKQVSGITSVVSNSVSLNPRVHPWAAVKLLAAPFLVDRVLRFPYIDPRWSELHNSQKPLLGRMIARLVGLVHLECNDNACNLISFTWGSGHPAIWQHQQLDLVTHDRATELFGPVGMEYFRNVRKSVFADNTTVRYRSGGKYDVLPRRYIDNVGQVRVPTLLMAGQHNDIFPGSNRLTYDRVRAAGSGSFRYQEFADYGHQDLLMGKHCDADVFPTIVDFMREAAT
jgi:pimeloyl-ACP methyl ester carboxylesterase